MNYTESDRLHISLQCVQYAIAQMKHQLNESTDPIIAEHYQTKIDLFQDQEKYLNLKILNEK